MKNNSKIQTFFIGFCITVFLLIAVLFHHEYIYFKRAMKLEKQNKKIYAIDNYGYAIISYIPFSPIIKKSEKKILDLGKCFEKKKELYKALFAYETLRSSYFQVRSFYQPRKKLIEQLNYKIAKIKVAILKKEGRLNVETDEFKRQLNILQHNNFPSTAGSFILCFSFLGWVGAVFFMIFKGFEKGNTNKKIITFSFALYILFFFIWIISLYSV